MKKITLILVLAIVSIAAHATIWRVNSNVSIDADFRQLQTANDSSIVNGGDTIYMENGTYNASANITKHLVIIGPGYFLAVNDSTHAYPSPAVIHDIAFNAGSDNSKIMGMKVTNAMNISAATSNVTIERNHISYLSYTQVYYASSQNIHIRQNYIYTNFNINYNASSYIENNIITCTVSISSSNCVFANNTLIHDYSSYLLQCANTSVYNNIIINTGTGSAIRSYSYDYNENNTFANNVLSDAAPTTYPWPSNYYNASESGTIVMTGVAGNYYKLASASPAIGYGTSGQDCGAYDGVYPYVLSGLPAMIPHIFEATIPSSADKSTGLNVNIKIKAQNQ